MLKVKSQILNQPSLTCNIGLNVWKESIFDYL